MLSCSQGELEKTKDYQCLVVTFLGTVESSQSGTPRRRLGMGPKLPDSTSRWEVPEADNLPLGGNLQLPRVREMIQPS